jgi:cell division protein FtsL
MPLLAIEIDLSSFFNINIIVFTTIAFVVSVIVTILLVLGIRPITARARKANNLEPEKLNITYLRLIIYIFAELIAFVSDMFLVIFSMSYTIP